MSKTTFDFSNTQAAKESNYLRPGVHKVKVSKVEAGAFDKSDVPYLAFTFEDQSGTQLTEKFVLKTKDPNSKTNPLARLQYLHEAWSGKLLDKAFKSVEEMEAYFTKVFVSSKAGARLLIVGGEINGKIVYGRVPYTGFLVTNDELEIGEFEEGSDEWKKYVKKSTRTTEATGKKGGLLNDDEDADDDDDLPFGDADDEDEDKEEKKSDKKADKKAPAKTDKNDKKSTKPAPKKAAKEEDADDEDDADEDSPW